MAQHDYSISNQGFPATRQDLNNVLDAIRTNNSGTSAPSSQYAGQFWIDTTSSTWTLYIHDGADDIEFATIDTSANTVNFRDSTLAIVTDPSPQLGANLDLNSNDITGTGDINITGDITASGNLTSTGIDDNATSTAITINSSENVGIGTASPSEKLHVSSGGSADIQISPGANQCSIIMTNAGATDYRMRSDNSPDGLILGTSSIDAITIDSSGHVGIGTTSPDASFTTTIQQDTTGFGTLVLDRTSNIDATFRSMVSIERSGTVVGTIKVNNTATQYNTASDYRLKENVVTMSNATDRLKQLKPKRFNFILNPDITVDGFLAHEVQDVVPEAISGTHNETETKEKVVVNANGQVIAENIEQADWEAGKIADEDGNTQYPTDSTWEATKVVPVYQGIDQAKLVPLLVKTIQELEARITALETQP